MKAHIENHITVDTENSPFRGLPPYILAEVITVTKVVGSIRTIYRGSVGTLIVLGVLTPPEA